MSLYLVNKFLYQVDRDQALLERYRTAPAETVTWWEEHEALRTSGPEFATPRPELAFTPEERSALVAQDYEVLYRLGAHPFILFTTMLPVHEEAFGGIREFGEHYKATIHPYGRPDYSC